MKIFLLVAISLITSRLSFSQDLQKVYNEAVEAYKRRDSVTFYLRMQEAYNIFPYNETILYKLGIAAALNQKIPEGFEYLQKAILINSDLKLDDENDLSSLQQSKEWQRLIALQKSWQEPISNSTIAFTIKDRQLHPEVIEFDATEELFYVGSIHKRKIVKIDKHNFAQDFCISGFEGMTSVFGIKIDKNRNLLWACSSPLKEMIDFDSTDRSAVFKLDLSSGKLIKRYEVSKQLDDATFQDLILDMNGNVYLSESNNNQILTINSKNDELEPMFKASSLVEIQGISFSKDEKYIFIADYEKGLFRLEVATKILDEVVADAAASTRGIDGIYYFNNSILAVQNGTTPARVVQFYLNARQNNIKSFRIIDKNRPDFGEPTTGVLNGKVFYYIANSQWSGYDANHQILPSEYLKDAIVLKSNVE